MLAVGSSPAISVTSRRSSCLLFERARVAVLARALFLAMNSSSCLPLGQHRGVRPLVVLAALLLVFQKGVDLAGKHRQLAARQVERVAARRAQERPVVRDDQAGLGKVPQKMLEQDLRAQVEEVRRLVEQQQVRFVQQQGRQLDARLPAAGELGDRPFEIGAFQLELAGDFAAFPVGLAAVAHQKLERRFARQERIVLAQIAQPQLGMADDLALVELFFAQQDAQQRALAGAVAADEADLDVVGDRGFGTVEQHLVAIALVTRS